MAHPTLAHIVRDVGSVIESTPFMGWLLAASAGLGLLTIRHLQIKNSADASKSGWIRSLFALIAITTTVTLGATATVGSATQPVEGRAGLPDLISDRPFIWREQIEVDETDGSLLRVLAFDGYLHNVGNGSLDLFGNPQIPGDVVQRVFDGESWTAIEAANPPTVRYETNDGHNHFHLIGVSDYALFDEARQNKVTDSSKIGFCLVDTEQMDDLADSFYDIDRYRYCEQDSPDATELRMGISPGWRDTYDANTTLQWVDVSAVQPGRYWIGAITDPQDEVAESNEDNNGLTYSLNTFPVAGYSFQHFPAITVTEPATEISLPAQAIGLVGEPVWTIVTGPTNGKLDVPVGSTLRSPTVRYTPEAGFVGTDTIEWQVRDSSRIFPLESATTHLKLEVPQPIGTGTTDEDPAPAAPQITSTTTSFSGAEYASVDETFTARNEDGELRWFAKDLPAGLTIDETTGTVSGAPTARGTYDATIVAWNGTIADELSVTWTVGTEEYGAELRSLTPQRSGLGERIDVFVGSPNRGATYEATGLPEGINAVSNIPWLSGTPTEVGTYDVTLTETIDGETTAMTSFTWTVIPAPIPAFPL